MEELTTPQNTQEEVNEQEELTTPVQCSCSTPVARITWRSAAVAQDIFTAIIIL